MFAAGAGFRAIERQSSDEHDDNVQSLPVHPSQWDVRVADLVDFVEAHRGLAFAHPVDVQFLAEPDFVALFEPAPGDGPDDESRAEAATYAATDDAFALSAGYDPIEAETTVSQVTTLGFFDFDSQTIYVRGAWPLSAPVRVVLVHELTHALQDQSFEFQLGGSDDLEVRAVAEADAMRIEAMYYDTLPESDRAAADVENGADDQTEVDLAGVPWAVVEASSAPYVLGPLFLSYIDEQGGNAAVNRVFADFPTGKELLTPSLYAAGVDDIDVIVSAPGDSAVIVEPGPWAMFDALVMLDAWLPWRQARSPFDGWSGGGRVSFEGPGGVVCVAATAAFDNESSATMFAQAVVAWAGASGSGAIPRTAGTQVSFEGCERAAATDPPRPVLTPSNAAFLEHAIVEEADPTTADQRVLAVCIARTLIDDPVAVDLWWKIELTPDEVATAHQQTEIARSSCAQGA